MKNKLIILLAAAVLMGIMAIPAFADTATDAKAWFEQRFSAKQEAVDRAVEEGFITTEQGEQMKARFEQMYRLHEENGFTCPLGNQGMMGSGYRNYPNGNQGRGPWAGNGRGMGPGMGINNLQQNNIQTQ